jgi:LemA protein
VKKFFLSAVVLVGLGIGARVRFVTSRESLAAHKAAVTTSWTAVDAALRDHAELLPALEAKVKVTPKLETQVQQTIAEVRGVLDQPRPAQEKIQAYTRLSRETARLLLAADQDTALRRDPSLSILKDQLTETDNRIMIARRKYNEALERYNASLAVFPHNVVAAISGFSRDDSYFPTGLESRPSTKE